MTYLEELNEEQKRAVLETEGPSLILAGAGSGKTRVITSKIAHIIDNLKVAPWNILAITFTNKAANEMRERVEKILEIDADSLWIGTFHSICVRILRMNIEKIGYESNFTIYDRADQITLEKECIADLDINKDMFDESYILGQINNLKNQMISPEDYEKETTGDFYKEIIFKTYKLYQEKLKEYNALDFDNLLIKTVELFNKNEDVLNFYQDKFKYVFVDEYQDTNRVQYELISLISSKNRNLSVIGDSDQSIYGWRGADIKNIQSFEKDYPDAKIILLERNYRSTQEILELANHVISKNPNRKDKNLWTDRSSGNKPKYIQLSDERDEANYVVKQIASLVDRGDKYSDNAILYRTNAQSRTFEEALIRRSIPYKIVGGLKFYDRMEIKDLIAYLRLISNPVDNVSFKRIVNTPRRGIGQATIDKLENYSQSLNLSLYEGILMLDTMDIGPRARKSLEGFKYIIEDLVVKKEELSLSEYIRYVLERTGYIEDLEKENSVESRTRIENIEEFITVAIDFERNNKDIKLEEFLNDLALLSDVDKTEDTDNAVTLMTIHSSKGLEFKNVFLVGMEDGLFPSYRSIDSEDPLELEEERRLCYVAITRAEENLFITNAKVRTLYGKTNYTMESRYIADMEDYIEKDLNIEKSSPTSFKDLRRSSFRAKQKLIQDARKGGEIIFSEGDRIEHKKFGLGRIVQIEKLSGNDSQLTIIFDDHGLKILLQSISPIELVR